MMDSNNGCKLCKELRSEFGIVLEELFLSPDGSPFVVVAAILFALILLFPKGSGIF